MQVLARASTRPEIEVTSQGETLEEARANLAEALALYFEDEAGDCSVEGVNIVVPGQPQERHHALGVLGQARLQNRARRRSR